jgi:hypothetical protein
MITFETNSIWINYIVCKPLTEKVLRYDERFAETFANLTIDSYTNTWQRLSIIIVLLAPDFFAEKERLIMGKKTKKLEIRINADYDRLLQADERETLQIIAETYLKAIEIFLIPRKDFEGKKFYQDVKNLFEKEEILEKSEL